jgi:pimeloyl-ACP methyl ester carboxylesterase
VFEDRFKEAVERGNGMAGVRYRGLARDWIVQFDVGEESFWLKNSSGQFSLCPEPADTEVTFRLAASAANWKDFFDGPPEPGFQTLNAMVMTGALRLSGEVLVYQQYLLALELMFGRLPGPQSAVSKVAASEIAGVPATIEPVVGRYLNLNHQGRPHRIYFEEAGEGIPLLCLHTAGADGRQYRGLLNDAEITDRYRVIVFDLPRHGKSSLSPGHVGDQYVLTTDAYVDIVMAVVGALQLDQPVVMGCSIGGRAVLHLALRHGADFRAAIGLQSALYADSGGEDMSGNSASSLFRPDANGAEIGAALVAAIMAPDSPSEDRWETLWYYMQGGPGVFLGDLYYYFEDGDLRNRIQGSAAFDDCPLYLLTGEYDLSATPQMTAELAETVNAVHFEVMQGLGHFPMSEHYAAFRNYLIPILETIENRNITI